jgi:hypothetical protein
MIESSRFVALVLFFRLSVLTERRSRIAVLGLELNLFFDDKPCRRNPLYDPGITRILTRLPRLAYGILGIDLILSERTTEFFR